MAYAIKAVIPDPDAETFDLPAQKTMYGGKLIALGDPVFVFASESSGGAGLVARGVVARVEALPKLPGLARQAPRVSLAIRNVERAKTRLGRAELRGFTAWDDGRPETELNFKFYRQATDKISEISDEAAEFLAGFF